jgi:hypothetical protein
LGSGEKEQSMSTSRSLRDRLFSDGGILIWLALVVTLVHTVTNGQYGFHRDELDTLDNARNLAWGYVAYPPLTPFIGRIGLELFGSSLIVVGRPNDSAVNLSASCDTAARTVIQVCREIRQPWSDLWDRLQTFQ